MSAELNAWFAETGELAFPKRALVMPWRHRTPIDASEHATTWRQLQGRPRHGRKGLAYVHVPFCANHCLFCGFYQNRWQEEASRPYTDRLIAEIEREADTALVGSAPIHAVYLGGGTPSALAASDLARLITTLRTHLPLAPDAEITVEGRIRHFDDARIDACLDAGANRFSIGVQSFDTRVRQRLGRQASREQAIAFLESLAARDRAAVVCDLIFGLPDQDDDVWARDLETVCALPLDGVDLYALNLLPTTPLSKAVELQRRSLSTPQERQRMYLAGLGRLAEAGWQQLSNSHWARTTRERNLYNQLIKDGADCLAFGSGGGGSAHGISYVVDGTLAAYEEKIDAGLKPLSHLALSDPWQPAREAVTGGIERGRLDLSRLPVDDTATLIARLQPLLGNWHETGLLADAGPVLRLTPRGRFWANNLHAALNDLIPQLVAATLPAARAA
ncbi:heme anaerobic degradation radical SAM methyltransferase ChuW/HutW [Jeongeupia naejangsanensis]|uniref:Heme anaerobic degradation radical SAM methyltransferase ChuW/HutW n=1 Tax=Jeongeupia naejangsanensis TaxID=613195 RepID=A0ABS2BIS8_9NEIS|nr:heme anaerobic degradation radical SAM methyltransferase ChuW/HutW [Jeongeupia naejangsanensis]MBM3115503.1 heme anaerobic degradation radical SAM methyltransferase ChuW/HutW [Jeongeupia naejangsanensis]